MLKIVLTESMTAPNSFLVFLQPLLRSPMDGPAEASRPRQRRRTADEGARHGDSFFVGVMLLLLVVLLWTGSNFLTNYQLTRGYDKPFAVTYLNTASFAIYMIPFACVLSRQRHKGDQSGAAGFQGIWSRMGFYLPPGSMWRSEARYSLLPSSSSSSSSSEAVAAVDTESNPIARLRQSPPRPSSIDGRRPRDALSSVPVQEQESGPPLDLHQTASLAANFMIVWFMANYCLNVSLKLTSVASATTLSSASGFFTLALGSMAGVEIFSVSKLLAVATSFTGVLLVTRADATTTTTTMTVPFSSWLSWLSSSSSSSSSSSTADNAYLGDLLALSSAFFYAVYVVMLKKRIGDESRVSMPLFFGFVGIFNITLMWPVGVLLHVTGIETLEWPSGSLMWAGVLVNMCITFVSDMAYLLAMLKSSPLVATVGLSLTIPLAIAGDTLLGSHTGGLQSYMGSIVVLVSFVGIGLADRAGSSS
ncbi:hypothetical protein CBS101457_003700 [Exobasidium rhododendri]|nr:hypothetical protein CBS101457_003700 [Exobasidium rhododendri]